MKNSVIWDIFNGTRGHRESMHMQNDDDYKDDCTDTYYQELMSQLNTEQIKLFEAFVDALENNSLKEVDFYFVEGFKLGMRIGVECMEK